MSERIIEIKNNHEMEISYITLEELIQDERSEGIEIGLARGRSEGISKALDFLGVSEEAFQQMLKENIYAKTRVI